MKRTISRTVLAALATCGLALAGVVVGASSASAYQPTAQTIYSTDGSTCNKGPCLLYPKSAQLPSGRVVMAFEDSEGPVAGQTTPIYKSDDNGDTWQKLTNLKPPSQLTSDPAYANWTSSWTNPFFYVLPQDFGGMPAGTLLLANLVSSSVSGSNDRPQNAIVLYASNDQGSSWRIVNTIATSANTAKDPVWEPFLMMYQGKLVTYYSDEHDYLGYDSTTGVPTLDPDDATAADSGGQVLVHKTWDGSSSSSWSSPVIDVAGKTQDMGGGKTEIGAGRPGMTTVVPTTDGKWMMTFEDFSGDGNVHYKIASDPLKFYTVTDGAGSGTNVGSLPVTSGSGSLSQGGSPVLMRRPDGAIFFNAAGSGDVWVNESGSSTGSWKEYHTSISGGYSRTMQYLSTTGQILFLSAPFANGPITSSEVDFGNSTGTYYTLVNRANGQVLAPAGGRTQDAQFTGNAPDIATQARNDATSTQWWHLVKKNGQVTFLNKAGGRALGIWQGTAKSGQQLAQWVDDNGSDKRWNLVRAADGYVRLQSSADPTLAVTANSSGTVDLEADTNAAAQQWQLVIDFGTTASSTFSIQNSKSGKSLGVLQGSTAVGASAVQWTTNGAADQSWKVTRNSAGKLVFTNANSGNALGVLSGSTSVGAQAVQWTPNGAADQQWSLTGTGPFTGIKNSNSGLVLGVQGGSTADGANAVQWTDSGSADQQWSLVQTSTF